MFSKLRLRKGIAYLLIWLQLLTPGLSLLPMVARASEPADMQSTIRDLTHSFLALRHRQHRRQKRLRLR